MTSVIKIYILYLQTVLIEVVGSIPTEVKRFFLCLVFFASCANAQWVIHGFK